jgi:hypothetical protein
MSGETTTNRPFVPVRAVTPGRSRYLLLSAALLCAGQNCAPVEPQDPPLDDSGTAGIVTTVVGTGQSVFDGDGRPALETSFYFPFDVEFDSAGRALIDDWNNLRIRRLNDDGTIETIMGVGYEDAPTEGSLATQTPLHHASDIEMDDQGRLFVAGYHVPVVFVVGTDNRVTVVAGAGYNFGYSGDGGPAVEAEMFAPYGVMPTADGGFYFSDQGVHVVRYVAPDGIIQTVAGTGDRGYSGDAGPATEALLNGPTRLRLDDAGNLYICDTDNHAVRRLAPGGMITTVAGTGTVGYSGDGGPADEAQLNSPYDVRFSPSGNLYIADAGNNVIRRVDHSGVITTVVGTGESGFAGDGGDARDCRLNRPSSIIFDAEGSLWISDTLNHRVRRVEGFLAAAD